MSLGLKIKQLRQERHWTQAEVAALSGVSRQYVSCLENRKNLVVSGVILAKLARGFGVELQVLLAASNLRTVIPEEDQPISYAINNPELRKWVTFQNLNRLTGTIQRVIVLLIQAELESSLPTQEKRQECQLELTEAC